MWCGVGSVVSSEREGSREWVSEVLCAGVVVVIVMPYHTRTGCYLVFWVSCVLYGGMEEARWELSKYCICVVRGVISGTRVSSR